MGTTTLTGYPYPDPTDRARNGSVGIRALAEAVEGDTRDNYVTVGGAAGPVDLVSNVWTPVNWTSELHSDGDFTVSGAQITYAGTETRLYLVSYSVGLFGVTRNARLIFPGAQPVTGDYSDASRFSTLTRTTLALLTPGATFGLEVMVGGDGVTAPKVSDPSMLAVRQ